MRFSHAELQELIQRSLSEPLPDDVLIEVNNHMAVCPACAALRGELALLEQRLPRALRAEYPLPYVNRAEMTQVIYSHRQRTQRSRLFGGFFTLAKQAAFATAGVALVAMIAVLAAYFAPSRPAAPAPQEPAAPAVAAPEAFPLPAGAAPAVGSGEAYNSENFAVQIQVPVEWQMVQQDPQGEVFSGDDGFVRLATLPIQATSLDQACAAEAASQPGLYGDSPQINRVTVQEFQACLIIGEADDEGGAGGESEMALVANALVVEDTRREPEERFWIMAADAENFEMLASSLTLIDEEEPVVVAAEPPAEPQATLAAPAPVLLPRLPAESLALPEGLRMDIHPMTRQPFEEAGYEPYLRALGDQSLLAALPQGRSYWDTADLARMQTHNAALAPFGYRLESQPVEADTGARWFTLYRGDEALIDPVTSLGIASVNASGSNFLLLVDTTGGLQLVQYGSIEPWRASLPSGEKSAPQFLGDDILYAETRPAQSTPEAAQGEAPAWTVDVYRSGAVIYSREYQNREAATGFIGFWTYGEHWALETVDQVVIDGQDVNMLFGYEKSYEFHLLDGKPLYFFESSGRLGVSFDGKTALLPFSSVPHYACCSAAEYNPVQVGDVLLLFGQQEDAWFYIEATGQPPTQP